MVQNVLNPRNTEGGQFYPLFSFFPFFPKPARIFLWKNWQILEAPICDLLMVSMFGVDSAQSYWKITKSPIQDFIDFPTKPY